MPALANAKHEAFARAIVSGSTGADAYLAAGYKASPVSAAANAGRLLKNDGIRQRIDELKAAAADATVMNLREVLAELSKLGRSNMQDFLIRGEDTGEVIAALSELAPEHAAAIQEMTVETYLEGRGDDAREVRRVRLKLHSKIGALAELRAHYEPQRHEVTGKDGKPIETKDVSELSDLEVARRIAFLLTKATKEQA